MEKPCAFSPNLRPNREAPDENQVYRRQVTVRAEKKKDTKSCVECRAVVTMNCCGQAKELPVLAPVRK